MKLRTTCGSCKSIIVIPFPFPLTPIRYHGGWLAPNIYFLGHAGCVRVNGVRIAGASGIFKGHDFQLGGRSTFPLAPEYLSLFAGHHERVPYDSSSMRSIYHIREYNVRRLSLVCRLNYTFARPVLIPFLFIQAFFSSDFFVP